VIYRLLCFCSVRRRRVRTIAWSSGETKHDMAWGPIYIALAAIYFAAIMVAGIRSARHKGDSNQYLNATSSLPLWICAMACIAANCGSLDIFAMMALGAQYGMLACHFYWIGAIPALLAVAFWLLPIYKRNRHPTILDFIARHYGNPTRSMVALCMAAMMLLIAGVGLYAVAETASAFLGWTFLQGILVAATIVLFYTWIGGFRATVYTELIHFALVLVAVVPLLFLVAHQLGGFRRMMADIPASRIHTWQGVPFFAPHAVMDRVGWYLVWASCSVSVTGVRISCRSCVLSPCAVSRTRPLCR